MMHWGISVEWRYKVGNRKLEGKKITSELPPFDPKIRSHFRGKLDMMEWIAYQWVGYTQVESLEN